MRKFGFKSKVAPHGGVLVRGEQAVAGLHASNSHCPLSWLAGHKHWLLVRLLRHRNLLQRGKKKRKRKQKVKIKIQSNNIENYLYWLNTARLDNYKSFVMFAKFTKDKYLCVFRV